MSDGQRQAVAEPENGADTPTLAEAIEVANRIAKGLARLAELARSPLAARSLPVFADALDGMKGDAEDIAAWLADAEEEAREDRPGVAVDELAAVLAESKEGTADECGTDELAELGGPFGVANAGRKVADAEPLTWRGIVEAEELLSRRFTSPTHPQATPTERVQIAAEAACMRQLQRAVAALNPFMDAMLGAVSWHRARDGAAPSIEASAELAIAAWDLARSFQDLDEAGAAAPPRVLAKMLEGVQVGRKPAFSRSIKEGRRRATSFSDARVMGLAACALDARMKADDETCMAAHANKVAEAVKAATGESCDGGRVRDWRNRCKGKPKDEKGPGPFGANHPARHVWETYLREVVKKRLNSGVSSDEWMKVAAFYEAAMRETSE